MGKKDVYIDPGEATLTIKYDRIKEVEDPTTSPTKKKKFLKFGTKGSMELAEELFYQKIAAKKDITRDELQEFLDMYYAFRTAHEAGIPTIPMEEGG